jgi:GTP-binding protein
MLDLHDIRLARAARTPEDFPRDGRPQICFAGRSNVGKSSLLNTLVGRRDVARTSKTPGRTREIHFFLVADRFYFVDLPGYGYAKVSRGMRRQWGELIEAYILDSESLRLMIVILDIRHDPSEDDLDLIAWLESRRISYLLALTKCDKVSGSVAQRQHQRILEVIGAQTGPAGALSTGPLCAVRFSARTGEGRLELVRAILATLKQEPK